MTDLKAIGAANAARGRARGLTGRDRLARMTAAYEAWRADGTLPATYEVVYGVAWAGPGRDDAGADRNGEVAIPLAAIGRRR
jgi:malonyl-CoA O-methyltransferase